MCAGFPKQGKAHMLVNRTSDTVIRLLPPYVITAAEFDEGVAILEEAIAVSTTGAQA